MVEAPRRQEGEEIHYSMKTRGMGSLYRRGKTWWVQYSFRGRLYRESSRSQVRAVAVRLLRMRQAEMARGRLAAPDAEKVTFDDLVELIRADYLQKQNRTWDRVEHAIKHLRPAFVRIPAVAIGYGDVSNYISARLKAGAARGTVHHEIAALGRMLKLAVLAGKLHVRVPLPVLKLDNVRKGFFTDDEARRVLKHLPDWYGPPIEFAWRTGWRIDKVKALTWAQVDFAAGTVRLEPGTTKNREGRIFPFAAPPLAGGAPAGAVRAHAGVAARTRPGRTVGLLAARSAARRPPRHLDARVPTRRAARAARARPAPQRGAQPRAGGRPALGRDEADRPPHRVRLPPVRDRFRGRPSRRDAPSRGLPAGSAGRGECRTRN